MARKTAPTADGVVVDGWHPISDDGQRLVKVHGTGYAIYRAHGEIDPTATSRDFQWCGWVPEFVHAEQWLNDGAVCGDVITVPVTPKGEKAKRG